MIKPLNWKHLALVVVAIPIVAQVSTYIGRSLAEVQNRRDVVGSSPPVIDHQIQVVVSSQDAEGITQADFNIDFLKNLEAYTIERVKARTAEALASQGYRDVRVDVDSEATYVESGPIKLAIIRLRSPGDSNQVVIIGIVGKELKRVACVRASSGPLISISYGACGDKIREVFGTSLIE